MGTSKDSTGIKGDTVKNEAMEWMLDNLHYYCPVNQEGKDKLVNFADKMEKFVDKMEEEERQEAVDAYKAITENFCNDIGLFMYGNRNGEGIVSRHTDAYLVSDVLDVSDFYFPVGFCRGRENVNNEKMNLNRPSENFINKTNEILADNIKVEIKIKCCIVVELLLLLSIFVMFGFVFTGMCERSNGAAVLSVILVLAVYVFLVLLFRIIMGFLHIKQKKEYWRFCIQEGTVPVNQMDMCSRDCIIAQKMPKHVHDDLKEWSRRTDKRLFDPKRSIQEGVRKVGFLNASIIMGCFLVLLLWISKKYLLREERKEEIQIIEGNEIQLVLGTKEVSPIEEMPGKKGIEGGDNQSKAEGDEEVQENTSPEDSFALEGVIFTDSNSRKLKREEIEALSKRSDMDYRTALGYARNEIYARMGYSFSWEGGKYSEHYSQYPWYKEIAKREITEDMFNEYERANIDLILKIERELGIIGDQPGD